MTGVQNRWRATLLGWGCLSLMLASSVLRAETVPDEPIKAKAPGDNKDNKQNRIERQPLMKEFEQKAPSLTVGERLDYDIRVSGVPAGKAFMEVRKIEHCGTDDKGPEVFVVALETRSNRAVSLMYDVDDITKSCIDVKGGFSRRYYIVKKEGNAKIQERIAFSYDIGSMEATYDWPRPTDGQWRSKQIPLIDKCLDPLSAVYYVRGIDLKGLKEDSFFLPICADKRVWNTKIKIVGRSLETVGELKDRECLIIEPEAEFKGLFERKGKMRIWVDSATGIVLKLTAEIPFGPAEVVLSGFKDSPLNDEK